MVSESRLCEICGQQKDIRGFANHVIACKKKFKKEYPESNPDGKLISEVHLEVAKEELEPPKKPKEIEIPEETDEDEDEPKENNQMVLLAIVVLIVLGMLILFFKDEILARIIPKGG